MNAPATPAANHHDAPATPAQTDALITIEDATVQFGTRKALNQVSLNIYPREIISLIGPNGAGKSTLVKVVLGLQKLHRGKRKVIKNLAIGYVPQHFHLSKSLPLRVVDLLDLIPASPAFLQQILQETGAQHLLTRSVQELSGGERQRVLLARALLLRPDLLVLDEPMQGLDMLSEAELYAYVRTLPERYGCAILMVSHDLQWVMQGTQRVICLNHHICCSGCPTTVLQDPAYQALFGTGRVPYAHHHDHCRHEDLAPEHAHAIEPHLHPEVDIDLIAPAQTHLPHAHPHHDHTGTT